MKVSFYPVVGCSPAFQKNSKDYSLSKALLQEFIAQKKNNREIANALGVSETYISIRMREEGLKNVRVASERVEKCGDVIISLLKQGAGLKEIRKNTGLAVNTIRLWIENTFGKPIVAVKQDLRLGKAPGEISGASRYYRRPSVYAQNFADEIKDLLDKGYSKSDIAKMKDCSVATVFAYIKQFNLELSRSEKTKLLSKVIVSRLLQGETKEDLIKDLGVSRHRIDSAVREFDLQAVVHKMVIDRHAK